MLLDPLTEALLPELDGEQNDEFAEFVKKAESLTAKARKHQQLAGLTASKASRQSDPNALPGSFDVGPFTFLRRKGSGTRFASGWQATCRVHQPAASSKGTGILHCTREHTGVDDATALRRLKYWCSQAPMFEDTAAHMAFMRSYTECVDLPTVEVLDAKLRSMA
ncbi:MAG: hypothetical protein EOO77_17175 [Oxalobacteraceae bacterium]|nr:MAG: hypothetical protein EOO77_17175 [Oxalobacteraceae bacterium]